MSKFWLSLGGSLFVLSAVLTAIPAAVVAESRLPPNAGLTDILFPRKPIDTSITGINAFANDAQFGSIRSQLQEVKNTLRLKYIRVLFAWDDNVQPTPASRINFSFYDNIAKNIPRGTEALVILTGVPSWMQNSANWIDGDPRKTFVQRWVKKVVNRYQRTGQIKAFQIWNEPNDSSNIHNSWLSLTDSPNNYVEMLSQASSFIKSRKRVKKVVNAATTAINQGYPRALDYNKSMISAGALNLVDRWAVHYYGSQYENVLRSGGVGDFLKGLSKPIWITESGAKGINEQREYVERTWTFLKSSAPGIARFYLYQFTENSASDETYGLRNPTPGFTVSDLYIYLRDRS